MRDADVTWVLLIKKGIEKGGKSESLDKEIVVARERKRQKISHNSVNFRQIWERGK